MLIHVAVIAFFAANFSFFKEMPEEVIEIGFGEPGGGSGGASPAGNENSTTEKDFIAAPRQSTPAPANDKRDIPQKQTPPAADNERIAVGKDTKANREPVAAATQKGANNTGVSGRGGEGTNPYGTGHGNGWGYGSGDGNGNGDGRGDGVGDGYSINFVGKVRRILSYIIPKYPDGVNKVADIRIRFSILPDGNVGNIVVLTKADRRLENAAVSSLRKWRFEPLRGGQTEQSATIVFPFRLE